jgi:hypothetical protein
VDIVETLDRLLTPDQYGITDEKTSRDVDRHALAKQLAYYANITEQENQL